jgi:hypothetical protein
MGREGEFVGCEDEKRRLVLWYFTKLTTCVFILKVLLPKIRPTVWWEWIRSSKEGNWLQQAWSGHVRFQWSCMRHLSRNMVSIATGLPWAGRLCQ